ncbi:penicillin-binding protein 2 [Cesiribacter andamanensis]|uniref:Penicillin-binding protein A n=1 Tax=Cesiribacter andamanensis AMV16 TaxID=1279009 RepID=M7N6Q1_9BACT|nr:penicillin-binding protein 2 [Cesiribacter andamanensis]EMR02962.1 Penicillin-binding protein A [Cesiribacter andamanensis AMV16]
MNDSRKYIIGAVFLLVALIYLAQLFSLQVIDSDYKSLSEANIIKPVEELPYRGTIYDRKGRLIVYNKPVYDLMIVTKEVLKSNLDTLRFCQAVGMTKQGFIDRIQAIRKEHGYSQNKPSVFIKSMSAEDFAKIQDHLVDYPGFFISPRTVRSYPYSVMSNALGYIAEISKPKLERDTTGYYKQGDQIGISGMEAKYEPFLRGRRGVRFKTVNVRGIVKGDYRDGELDVLSEAGKNLVSTIDLDLQQYAESLMAGKIGSVVALEPATGEILAIVSAPTYDPNMLTGGEFSKNFNKLQRDSLVPLFNRPIMALYPPGSMFKMVQALVGLQEKVITPQTRHACIRSPIGCHGPHSNEDLRGAIVVSCNPYFYQTFRKIINQDKSPNTFVDSRIGLDMWAEYMHRFGIGVKLGVDMPGEKAGNVPLPAYYDRVYRGQWKFSNIYSLSIGQGELGVTPLQMANLAAIIGNKGHYYTPHLVKSIGENGDKLPEYKQRNETGVESHYFQTVIDAMEDVVLYGTGQYRAKIPGLDICGKTSTVQNPHGEDHSGFMAFAPKNNPQIAVAVYVENAGQGARSAAAIASLVVEKYMLGEIKRKNIEEYVYKGKFN